MWEKDLKSEKLEANNLEAVVMIQGASQVVLAVKNLPANTGDIRDSDLIPGLGRCPGERHGNPLQYSFLENPMHRDAWWTTGHRIAKSDTTEVA